MVQINQKCIQSMSIDNNLIPNSLLETLRINGEMVRGFNPNIFEYTIVHPLQFEKYLENIYGVASK